MVRLPPAKQRRDRESVCVRPSQAVNEALTPHPGIPSDDLSLKYDAVGAILEASGGDDRGKQGD